ncbi:hypothetical protein SDC9_120131 [bioreactor metagenome]|uniref:DUF4406 domain-containing protein n=2 Tax=root TaxID=1 RepID=A0A645C6G3_9ZZZZ
MNVEEVTMICKEVSSMNLYVPVSPIHAFSFLDPLNGNYDIVKEYCLKLLKTCDEIWIYGKWWKSQGCIDEIIFATDNGIPMKFIRNKSAAKNDMFGRG